MRNPERSLDPPDCECGTCEECVAREEARDEADYNAECRADADRDDAEWSYECERQDREG